MLWEVEIRPAPGQVDREGTRVLHESRSFGIGTVREVRSGRSFLIQGPKERAVVERAAQSLLVDAIVEQCPVHPLSRENETAVHTTPRANGHRLLNGLLKPGATDTGAASTAVAMRGVGIDPE